MMMEYLRTCIQDDTETGILSQKGKSGPLGDPLVKNNLWN